MTGPHPCIKPKYSFRYVRHIAAHQRSPFTDMVLGMVLAFVAGAINAGGFLAIGQYTSHMTGILSLLADNIALGIFGPLALGIIALCAFTIGAASSAMLIHWGRSKVRRKQYAYPILLEACLLLIFGLLGIYLKQSSFFLVMAVPLLCFIMGLQNATITKISGARIRTTHMTGVITDIGIELGKCSYLGGENLAPADRKKLGILFRIVSLFFIGGLVGALGFGHIGYIFSVPLAGLLILVALPPLMAKKKTVF